MGCVDRSIAVFAVTDKLEQKRTEASSSTPTPFLKFSFLPILFIYFSSLYINLNVNVNINVLYEINYATYVTLNSS